MRYLGRFAKALVALVRVVLRLLYRVKVRGTIPGHERMLIIANHESFLDPILLRAFLPVSPTYLIHTTIARRWYLKLPLRAVRHAVVDTSKPMAMKTLLALVESGEPVIIFPEGRITVTGSLMKIYDGPAFVAAKSGCTVVPVHIDGAIHSSFSRMRGDFPRKLFPRITITVSPGETVPFPHEGRARERRRAASEAMRRMMQKAAYAGRSRKTLFQALVETTTLHGRGRRVLEDINSNFEPVSYHTILKGSLALGRLVSRITAEGETVGVLMPNANPTVYLLFGITASRRVAAMLNFTAGTHGMQNACQIAGIRTVLTSRAFLERANLAEMVGQLRDVNVICLEDLRARFAMADKLWLLLWALWNPLRALTPGDPNAPALIMFTSGSEGVPKGVALSHDCVLANVAQINAAFAFSCRDKFLSALPLFHSFGITAGVLVPLLKGCAVILYPSPLHYRTVPEFVYDHDCTVLFTTNTFLRQYAKAAHAYDFYSLKHLVVGAEKLTEDVRRICQEKFGLRILEGYGATECSPVIAVNTPLAARAGTVGELLPGLEYRIAPVTGLDGVGVLHVRGDNVMLGYLKQDKPGAIQQVESEMGPGWYDTGDVVTVSEGFIRIEARLKRFAKIAGEMVSLELVEQIAAETRPGSIHAATAYRDPSRGEAIVLFTEDATLDREMLRQAAKQVGVTELVLPRRVVHLQEIPVLGNGKRDYVTLSRMAVESTDHVGI